MDERLMVEILIPVACMDSCLRIQKFIYFFFSESSRIIKNCCHYITESVFIQQKLNGFRSMLKQLLIASYYRQFYVVSKSPELTRLILILSFLFYHSCKIVCDSKLYIFFLYRREPDVNWFRSHTGKRILQFKLKKRSCINFFAFYLKQLAGSFSKQQM